ncbi:N-acetylglucosamine-6-phosphate deacetylase [Yonghaparkia sp. Soil809]|uniref:N-acetylglucosamine-6-phosphate deacetylase n=1 Tax=Yonghaparkia sp. Soil809 TaxID=1736417 RepID=UPI0006F98790|nr:N-acetylglucosamine-6-phosphate deacetylase [Yonghaparkia sp. Soil809]KRF33008.1 N-acetylglucosamine-6-phosphate deacetylase [Yonghaparkia sp. Soil809]
MPRTLLQGAELLDASGRRPGWVLLDGDRIAAVGGGADAPPGADATLDLPGRTLTPGFIDLHGHGGGGAGFDDGEQSIAAALAVHRAHGTTRSVISLVANPVESLVESLRLIARVAADDPTIVGAHLEGPFLAPTRRGAHAAEHLLAPDEDVVEILLSAAAGALVQVTIAPELPGALDAIRRLAGAGVVAAVGHTDADEDVTRAAFDAGATMLTHAFNAMPGIHHRAPGPVAAAFDDERVVLELVLDGVHVHPSVARVAFRSAPGRIALVTDAMAAAGSADGFYQLGTLNVTVKDGIALLNGTSTIAGSTLTQDAALRTALAAGIDEAAAIEALTATPARVLGRQSEWGMLAAGFAADLVVLDADLRVEQVWAAGREIVGAA